MERNSHVLREFESTFSGTKNTFTVTLQRLPLPDFLFIMPFVLHRVCTNVSRQETVAEEDFRNWLSHHHVGEMNVTVQTR
jgi:hypothetical protein